jgi:hypothetical protein
MFKILMVAIFFSLIAACGSGYESKDGYGGGGDTGLTEEQREFWTASVQPIVQKSCFRCHNSAPWINDPEKFISLAQGRVANGSMPKAGSPEAAAFTPAWKTKLVNFPN